MSAEIQSGANILARRQAEVGDDSIGGGDHLCIAQVEPRLLERRHCLPYLGIGEARSAKVCLRSSEVGLRLRHVGLGLADVGARANALRRRKSPFVDKIGNDLAELAAGGEIDALLADLRPGRGHVGDRYVGRLQCDRKVRFRRTDGKLVRF